MNKCQTYMNKVNRESNSGHVQVAYDSERIQVVDGSYLLHASPQSVVVQVGPSHSQQINILYSTNQVLSEHNVSSCSGLMAIGLKRSNKVRKIWSCLDLEMKRNGRTMKKCSNLSLTLITTKTMKIKK